MAIQNRYEFIYYVSCTNCNPNGDPDMGNTPRVDPQTMQGYITDVATKRRIRNYVEMAYEGVEGMNIIIQQSTNINRHIEISNSIPPFLAINQYEAAVIKIDQLKELLTELKVSKDLSLDDRKTAINYVFRLGTDISSIRQQMSGYNRLDKDIVIVRIREFRYCIDNAVLHVLNGIGCDDPQHPVLLIPFDPEHDLARQSALNTDVRYFSVFYNIDAVSVTAQIQCALIILTCRKDLGRGYPVLISVMCAYLAV